MFAPERPAFLCRLAPPLVLPSFFGLLPMYLSCLLTFTLTAIPLPPSFPTRAPLIRTGRRRREARSQRARAGPKGATGSALSRLHRLLHDHPPDQQQQQQRHQQHQHQQQLQRQGEDEEAAKSIPQGETREGEQPDYDTFLPFLLLPLPPPPASEALSPRSPPPDPDEERDKDTTLPPTTSLSPSTTAAVAAAFKPRKMNSEKLANYAPTHFKFSPDDSYLTYLHAASHQVRREEGRVGLTRRKEEGEGEEQARQKGKEDR